MGEEQLAEEHLSQAVEICERDDWWSEMAARYSVPIRHAFVGAPITGERHYATA